MKTKELIEEISSLPVEDRVLVADSVLRSLNPPEAEIDKKWAKVAQKRLDQLQKGEVETIPGDQVFKKISQRYSK
ncbi:addiction module protein [Aliifodinibius sp. S!AR15-10]|uniref:addiction module protein n=1 Tax=Aliifodinibius sp. S!AR15-10 TaxID=2950437 RepID=UPI00285DD990|nr:addiction module protein [Aliifodinibius sp. S!AR15-10]MDR8389933.1 addiction module protein [Aliifodinibius sp. S!AR15-10]